MEISSRPASGMRDFLADDVKRRQWVIEQITHAYRDYGFEPLETPAIERLDVLTGKYGDEGDQLMFKLLVRGDKLNDIDPDDPTTMTDMALHYDLTVPLARVFAEYQHDLPKFYKRYQIQPVWRADRPQKGRFREFYQCDVDYVGTDSSIAELEVLGSMLDAMNRLAFTNLTVRINDRKILSAVIGAASIEDNKSDAVLTLVDKLDKIGKDGVVGKLQNDVGLSEAQLQDLTALIPGLSDEPAAQPFRHLGKELEARSAPTDALERMEALVDSVKGEAFDGQQIVFDPTLVRGMSYYTGPIFEFGSPAFDGSIAGGGRYDGLVGMFSGKDVPAVGGSLGLERILVIMDELDMFPEVSQSLDIFFVQLDEKALPHVLDAASSLRKEGFSVSVYPESTKLGKQFRYAESIGARYVALLGSREVEAGTVEIKDLETGNQEAVPADEVSRYVKKLPGT